jgi:hypothetical protein
METNPRQGKGKSKRAGSRIPGSSHMPNISVFYEKIVPVLLIIFGVVMVLLVLFAAAVVLGVVKF